MKINKRIVSNDKTVGYLVEDGSFVLPMCKAALFTEMYIIPLIESGYKYYGYDADNIEDSEGVPISTYTPVELSEFDEIEWYASVDLANNSALSDAEASKYYTFREESAIQFKTEEHYDINTREEFIAYLEQLKHALYTVNYSTDNRPINSFVHPDALFTIDEINDNPELKDYFNIIVKRHHIRNYGAYQELVNWLCSKGVLITSQPSTAEFLQAYYAWGPEGIKDKCTKVEMKLNVDGVFNFMKDPLGSSTAESYVFDNRKAKVSVIDASEKIHFVKTHEDIGQITDVKEFGRARILVPSNDQLLTLRRATNTGYKYQAVPGTRVSDVSDRLYITLISDSGYTYIYKVAHDQMKLGLAFSESNMAVISTFNNFSFASVVPSVSLPLDVIDNAADYYMWNLAIIKAAEIMKQRSYKAPVRSTSEFLLNDGVNPVAVIDIMAHAVDKNTTHNVNKKYALSNKDDDMCDAFELYLKDIPDYLLRAFNLTVDDLEDGINSFLELADIDDLRDRRDDMMNQKITPDMPGFDETFKDWQTKFAKQKAQLSAVSQAMGKSAKMYDAIDYYTKLKFVHDCLHGELSVDNFGDGLLADLGASYLIAAECILSVIYAEYGDNVSKEVAEDAILNIESSTLIDINKIFKIRDKALKGYMVDFASYRKNRACTNTWLWCYCTKVFREISNAPISKQRPYLMELVALDNSKADMPYRQLMTECVKQSMEKYDLSTKDFDWDGPLASWNEKKCAEHSIEYLASTLFFYILAGGKMGDIENDAYTVKLTMLDTKDLNITVPVRVYEFVRNFNIANHKRYITVYDFCKYEYNPNTSTGTFNFCLVNASVDPWHVKPKKGYNIKSYSLLPNYYEQNTLDSANGVDYYKNNCDKGAIAVSPLMKTYRNAFIPTSDLSETMMYEDMVRKANDVVDLEPFMDANQYEYIFAYVRRWAVERKRANAMGKKLISIPLKQDIVYAPLAYTFCEEIPSQYPVYADDISFDDKQAQTVSDVGVVSWKDYDITMNVIEHKQIKITEFSIHDIEYSDTSKISDILSGEWKANVPITVTGNYINVKGDTIMRIAVSKLTSADINNFVNAGIIRQISTTKYFVRAINGDYILEV